MRECDVAAISELGDDEATTEADVLITVDELSIRDLDDGSSLVGGRIVSPVVTKLILPGETVS